MVTKKVLDGFVKFLSPEQVSADSERMQAYGSDWTSKKSNPGLLVFPRNTSEVSEIIKNCANSNLKVVPSGGRTGLAGGACAHNEEVVVSLEKMNRILELDELSGTMTLEAGVILQDAQEAARKAGFHFPLDLAAKGSCQIGGNAATNAGGLDVVRYGMFRNHILGLEVVLADGEVLDMSQKLVKDNTGYDLKQFFIGSEGTLGIITKVVVQLFPAVNHRETFYLGLDKVEQLSSVWKALRGDSEIQLCAFELVTDMTAALVSKHHSTVRSPLQTPCKYMLLCEVADTSREHLESVLGSMFEAGSIVDASLAENSAQQADFWQLRELISETLTTYPCLYKNDVSVPVSKIGDFIKTLESLDLSSAKELEIFIFGHVGDGNLHINYVSKQTDRDKFLADVKPIENKIMQYVYSQKGSISAEHGIGTLKKELLLESKTTIEIEVMKKIKSCLDPNNILNPGKILDGDS